MCKQRALEWGRQACEQSLVKSPGHTHSGQAHVIYQLYYTSTPTVTPSGGKIKAIAQAAGDCERTVALLAYRVAHSLNNSTSISKRNAHL